MQMLSLTPAGWSGLGGPKRQKESAQVQTLTLTLTSSMASGKSLTSCASVSPCIK